MQLIGVTSELEEQARGRCWPGFRAWVAAVKAGGWRNWDELLARFPKARRTGDSEAHFPLAEDGTGVVARVMFHPCRVIRLLGIAGTPALRRAKKQASPSPVSALEPENTTPAQ